MDCKNVHVMYFYPLKKSLLMKIFLYLFKVKVFTSSSCSQQIAMLMALTR